MEELDCYKKKKKKGGGVGCVDTVWGIKAEFAQSI